MEGLAPPLACLIEIQSAIANGDPARMGAVRYMKKSSDDFSRDIRQFLFDWDQGREWRGAVSKIASPHRRAVIELLACAMSGQAILPQLAEMRQEIELACSLEIKRKMDLLPVQMLLPLLLLMFPSYLLLIFGPILSRFLEEVSK